MSRTSLELSKTTVNEACYASSVRCAQRLCSLIRLQEHIEYRFFYNDSQLYQAQVRNDHLLFNPFDDVTRAYRAGSAHGACARCRRLRRFCTI